MSFRIDDEKLLEKYKTIWNKTEDLKNIELNILPVYDNRYTKTKIRAYGYKSYTKSNKSKKCIICHYGYFNHGFDFQDSVCNSCHGLTMLRFDISDIVIITFKGAGYRCIIHKINKSEAIHLFIRKFCT